MSLHRYPLLASLVSCVVGVQCAGSTDSNVLSSGSPAPADGGHDTDGSAAGVPDGGPSPGEAALPEEEAGGDGGPSPGVEAGSQGTGLDAESGCGMRTGMRGKTTRSVVVNGTARSYVAYLPQSASGATPLPFVYVFHGASQTGSELFDATQYSSLADSDGIAVVFPDGQGASSATGTGVLDPWSVSDNGAAVCGAGAFANNPSAVDFAFLDAIKADVEQDQCLDLAHVFATGFSMGGYFTHHVACDRADIRAAAPHSGGTVASLGGCMTGHKPIIIFHGTSDPLIADGCDDPNGTAQSGFPPTATLWAQKNGCQTTYTTQTVDGAGGGTGQCYVYDGCPKDGQVELCTFTGMEHAWAGATTCQDCIGSGATYASATALQWAFFRKYAW